MNTKAIAIDGGGSATNVEMRWVPRGHACCGITAALHPRLRISNPDDVSVCDARHNEGQTSEGSLDFG